MTDKQIVPHTAQGLILTTTNEVITLDTVSALQCLHFKAIAHLSGGASCAASNDACQLGWELQAVKVCSDANARQSHPASDSTRGVVVRVKGCDQCDMFESQRICCKV